ncbi:MAG: hypothetical protein GY854_21490 [Deltaproteobacteria bacterium]|nr:hypothetical protein [Deltaproteobacteria bacterium]
MKRVFILLVLALWSVAATGCATAGFKTGQRWDPKEAPFFDDGVDMVEDLSSLSGQWGYKQENEFNGRLQLADFVAEVDILSVQTSTDLDGGMSKRIEISVVKKLYGNAPAEGFFVVSSKEAPGYELILRYEKHLEGRFYLFVRWFDEEDGKTGHHFHLSPVSDKLKPEVEQQIALRIREEEEAAAQK